MSGTCVSTSSHFALIVDDDDAMKVEEGEREKTCDHFHPVPLLSGVQAESLPCPCHRGALTKKRAELFSFSGSDINRVQGDAIYLQGVRLDMFSVTRNPVYKRIKEKETGFGLWRDVHQRRSWSDNFLPNTLFDANVAFERVALGGYLPSHRKGIHFVRSIPLAVILESHLSKDS